jgi:Flp pilus assembly protein TadD
MIGEATGGEAGGPPADPHRFDEIERLADAGRWEDAIHQLREMEAAHPDDPAVLGWLGVAAREGGAEGLAYEYFRRTLAAQPTDPLLLVAAGRVLARFDDPEAEGALRLAATLAPDLPEARMYYGAYLAREGHPEAAEQELAAAVALAPEEWEARFQLGAARALAGDAAAAAELLEGLDPPHDAAGWVATVHAACLVEAGRIEEAAETAHRASAEGTLDFEGLLLLALASAAAGWQDAAWEAMARAEASPPEAGAALLQEAEDALADGDEAAADFLREELVPTLLRERLQQMP